MSSHAQEREITLVYFTMEVYMCKVRNQIFRLAYALPPPKLKRKYNSLDFDVSVADLTRFRNSKFEASLVYLKEPGGGRQRSRIWLRIDFFTLTTYF